MTQYSIRPVSAIDKEWVRERMIEEWAAEFIIVHGESFHPADLPGFVAEQDGERIGLLTYRIDGNECEVMTLNSWVTDKGVGTALMEAAKQAGKDAGCNRLYLVTTNNNLHALRFYQKRGFVISAIRMNALAETRNIKPGIPLVDEDGIPIRDEIELDMHL